MLSVKQLKEILMLNRVDFKGCCEKQELKERVERLWQDHVAALRKFENILSIPFVFNDKYFLKRQKSCRLMIFAKYAWTRPLNACSLNVVIWRRALHAGKFSVNAQFVVAILFVLLEFSNRNSVLSTDFHLML